ncbi:hypothetical protein HDU96_000027 [Phlyctochytrium bullatum]|nr:hypothetical protein HDU96_000027 [Phlyctochytrium bullatum]
MDSGATASSAYLATSPTTTALPHHPMHTTAPTPTNPGLDAIIRKGMVTQKKAMGKARRNLLLVKPVSTLDILAVRDELAALERGKAVSSALDEAWGQEGSAAGPGGGPVGSKAAREKEVVAYGHLAFSAVTGNPLLILGTSKRTYLHFSKVAYIMDESDLGAPCQFTIVTSSRQEFKFICDTSPDYQQWITVLKDAYRETFGYDDDNDADRRRSSSRSGRRPSAGGAPQRPPPRARSSSTVRAAGGPDSTPRGPPQSAASRRPPSRSIERDEYDYYYDYESRGPPSGRPASVRSARSTRSTRSNASTRTATPRAPGDGPRSSAGRPSRSGTSSRGGSSGPRAPGDSRRQRSSSVAGREDERPPRRSTSRRYDDDDDFAYPPDDDDRRSIRSVSLPRNATGPNGQPLRSSLSRNRSRPNEEPSAPATSPIPPPRGASSSADDVFELAKRAMQTGLVEVPPSEASDDPVTAGTVSASASSLPGSAPPTPATFKRAPTASTGPLGAAASAGNQKPGFATRNGSLVRFSGYDESIVISPDDPLHVRRAAVRSNSALGAADPDGLGSGEAVRTKSVSSPALAGAASPRPSMSSDRRRGSAAPMSGGRGGTRPPATARTPSLAEQKRVVNALFDDDKGDRGRGGSALGAGAEAGGTSPSLSRSTLKKKGGARERSTSRGPTVRIQEGAGGRGRDREDGDAASIASRASRSSSVGPRLEDRGRRGSNASTASNVRTATATTSEKEAPKEKTSFFAALFGGGKKDKAATEAVADDGNVSGGEGGARRRSSSRPRRGSASSGSAPNLLASLTLVPSVRVDRTQSLASMFRRTEPGVGGDAADVAAASELAKAAASASSSPMTPVAPSPVPPPRTASVPADADQPQQQVLKDRGVAFVEEPVPMAPSTPLPPAGVPVNVAPLGAASPAPTAASSLRPAAPPGSPNSMVTASSGTYVLPTGGSATPRGMPGTPPSGPAATAASATVPVNPVQAPAPAPTPADGVSVSEASVNDRESMDSDSEAEVPLAYVTAQEKRVELPTPPMSSGPSPMGTPKPATAAVVAPDASAPAAALNLGGAGSPKRSMFSKKVFGRLGSKDNVSDAPAAPGSGVVTAVEKQDNGTTVTTTATTTTTTTSIPSLERAAGQNAFRKAFDTFNKKAKEFGATKDTKTTGSLSRPTATATTTTEVAKEVVAVGVREAELIDDDEVPLASPKALRRLGVVPAAAVTRVVEEKTEVVMTTVGEAEAAASTGEEEEEEAPVSKVPWEAKGKARAE